MSHPRPAPAALALACTLGLAACASPPTDEHWPSWADAAGAVVDWGSVDGQPVQLYTLENARGDVLRVTNYGAIITELHVPDRSGARADVVLGFDDLAGYLAGHPYFGCIAGRDANRIAGGRFELDGAAYQLATNNGPNHLHGGLKGFDKHVWLALPVDTRLGPALRLLRTSPDGEEGYPGRLTAAVTYTLTDDGELLVEMTAETDRATPCDLAQHSYWNLAGHDGGHVGGHLLQVSASRYTPVDATLIPTGELAPVAGTPLDFREATPIGARLFDVGGDPIGYDHNLVLDGVRQGPLEGAVWTGPWARDLRHVATVVEPASGRRMDLFSDQVGVQFYSGNFLDGTNVGKGGAVYEQYGGFCLETQTWPDAVHHPEWPSPILRPGATYHHRMAFRLSVEG